MLPQILTPHLARGITTLSLQDLPLGYFQQHLALALALSLTLRHRIVSARRNINDAANGSLFEFVWLDFFVFGKSLRILQFNFRARPVNLLTLLPSVTPHLAAWLLIPAAAAVQACNLIRIYQRHSRPLKWVAGGQQWQQQQQRLYAMAATATDSVSNVDWFCFILLRLLLLLLLFPWRPVRWLQSALPHHLHQQQQHHQKHGKHNVPHRKVEAEMCRIILLLLLLLPIQRQFFKLCPQW